MTVVEVKRRRIDTKTRRPIIIGAPCNRFSAKFTLLAQRRCLIVRSKNVPLTSPAWIDPLLRAESKANGHNINRLRRNRL